MVGVALLAAGCAGTRADDSPLPDVAGTWVGSIAPVGGILATMAGVGAGEVRMILVQRGRAVSGEVALPGARGTLSGALYENEFGGSFTGRTGQGAGDVPVTLTVTGDHMKGFVEYSPITLRRAR